MDGVFSIDWSDLLTAFSLVLIIEGILPFLHPASVRRYSQKMNELSDKSLRTFGFVALAAGLLILNIAR